MGLLSIFKRDQGRAESSPASADSVQQAKNRARRRLIGASVLVLMGIVGFPMLFESQPRPIPVDIPIEIPRADGSVPLTIPPARSQVIVVEPPVTTPGPASAGHNASAKPGASESSQHEPAAVVAPAVDKEKPSAGSEASSAKPVPHREARSNSESRSSSTPSAAEVARAQDKHPTPPASAGRFIVQVGAFADASAAKQARQSVEKLGLKTYTQVVETSSGSRIRVRVGPVDTREQAEKIQSRLKGAGLGAAVLSL